MVQQVSLDSTSGANVPTRRTVLAGGAWAVPAIVALTATPAFAVSGGTVSLAVPSDRVTASGAVTVTATVRDARGTGAAGEAVSFVGPTDATFTPPSATTDGNGAATSTFDLRKPWTKPGSTVTVSAVSGSSRASRSVTVLGANALVAGVGYTSTLAQAEQAFPAPVVQMQSSTLDGRGQAFLALLGDGTVWAKGDNRYGLLGDGTTTSRSTWAPVTSLVSVTRLSLGLYTAYALQQDGTLRAWGANGSGQCGNGTTASPQKTPSAVSSLTSVTSFVGGSGSAYAVSGGKAYAWGNGQNYELGDGSRSASRTTPQLIPGLTSVTQVEAHAAGGYALASGQVYAWGQNFYGQIGDGTTDSKSTPVAIAGLTGVTQIASAQTGAYALLSDGSVRSWGQNSSGQCGDGTTADRRSPVAPAALASGVSQLFACYRTGFALLADGTLSGWGDGSQGQFGDGTRTQRATPAALTMPSDSPSIDARSLFTNQWGPSLFLPTTV
ncbi:Ig-like domain-containing protein [Microbacterium sp. VKM Ac-2923]|uniref:Ig-like domain-containing protein n=1 Tax=Microbacterium sp. VKM Ac-2923 TaxID=2929476 RepID=UPI001FB409B4|nr:Ig-like domain-containing protein [Microbacterium sp. VKM Ac-2923]MCJ1707582.1 Ig-like domain-containing protein [Microbacterium sp. VKM Ac-2923]